MECESKRLRRYKTRAFYCVKMLSECTMSIERFLLMYQCVGDSSCSGIMCSPIVSNNKSLVPTYVPWLNAFLFRTFEIILYISRYSLRKTDIFLYCTVSIRKTLHLYENKIIIMIMNCLQIPTVLLNIMSNLNF